MNATTPIVSVHVYTHGEDPLPVPLWLFGHADINDLRKGDRVLVYDDRSSMIVRAESPT